MFNKKKKEKKRNQISFNTKIKCSTYFVGTWYLIQRKWVACGLIEKYQSTVIKSDSETRESNLIQFRDQLVNLLRGWYLVLNTTRMGCMRLD